MNEETLFAEALGKQGAARAAFLDEHCQDDVELRRRLEGLLRAHDHPDPFLDAAARVDTVDEPLRETAGAVIGLYKLIEQIGEGGMGAVWMAQQQEPVKRLVAIKLIKAGMDSKAVIARFEAERQALALMDHPNIARVLDAGTTSAGRPYFVMDLVKGVPITKYCDEHHLTPRQRLELYIPICQAVQHAHQKGIIHRDLKPSNVLVAHYDGKPVPKVIDFGVAKATGQSLTDKTLVTGFGNIVGTLEYMSPEQAEINQLDIDTRSDVYSLGVLLYELLAGSPPFSRKDLEKAGMLEMLRVIREQEPSKPSTKLSTAEGLPTLAANRGTEPAKLTKLVRGELDWIVMKALEKDRNRRYETANGFAMDLQRYLADEPVQACPPSVGYRLRKFVRRNKGPVMAAVVMVLLLIGGIVGTTLGLVKAQAEAEQKEEARKTAEENFRQARKAVDEYFTLVSQSKLLDVPGLQPLRKQLLEAAGKYYESFSQRRSDDPAVRVELAAASLRMAQLFQMVGESPKEVARAFEQGLGIVEELLQEHPAESDLYLPLAGFSTAARDLHEWTSPPEAALPRWKKAAEIWEHFTRAHPGVRGFRKDLAALYLELGASEKAHALYAREFTDDPAVVENRENLATTHLLRGLSLHGQGRPVEAAEACRKAAELREKLAADFPDIYAYQVGLAEANRYMGWFLADAGQTGEGRKAVRRALQMHQEAVRKNPNVPHGRGQLSDTWYLLGELLQRDGLSAEAKTAYHEAQMLLEKLVGEFPARNDFLSKLAIVQCHVAGLYLGSGQRREAEKTQRESLKTGEKAVAYADASWFDWQQLGLHYNFLGTILRQDKGRLSDAEEAFRRALETFEKEAQRFPAHAASDHHYHWQVALTHAALGDLLRDSGRVHQATDEFRRAVDLLTKPGVAFPDTSDYRDTLARLRTQASEPPDAKEGKH